MNNLRPQKLRLLLPLLIFNTAMWSITALAQEDTEFSGAGSEDPSRETDIAEDNYRRFMELKDPRLERPSFPVTKFQPGAGLEKMAALPEESQRHLRDLLRSVILAKGDWAPGDEQQQYAYEPSEAARRDGTLRRKEAEAWEELVGEYHEREAVIYAQRLAREQQGDAQGQSADGQAGRDDDPVQAQAPGQAAAAMANQQRSDEGPDSSNPGAPQSAGTPGSQTQQQRQQQQGARQQADQNRQSSDAKGRQARSDPQSASERQDGQEESESAKLARTLAEQPMESGETEKEDTLSDEGVSESALKFLSEQGLTVSNGDAGSVEADQPGSQGTNDTRWGRPELVQSTTEAEAEPESVSIQVTMGDDDSPASAPEAGTLSVEELRQARGVDAVDEEPEESFEGDG